MKHPWLVAMWLWLVSAFLWFCQWQSRTVLIEFSHAMTWICIVGAWVSLGVSILKKEYR